MPSPYTGKKMRIKITANGTTYTLGVVELVDLEILRQGGVESKYGFQGNVDLGTTPSNRHRVGMKRARFRVRRWFKADDANTDLLFDIHNLDTFFDLEEYLNVDFDGKLTGIKLNGCESYTYKTITGEANDIVGEEIIGEAAMTENMELAGDELWEPIYNRPTSDLGWWSHCATLDPWSANPLISRGLSTTIVNECVKSSWFEKTGNFATNVERDTVYIAGTLGAVFGVWVYPDCATPQGLVYFKLMKADGSYAGAWFNCDGLVYVGVHDPINGTDWNAAGTYTKGQWHWLEIYFNSFGGTVTEFHLDGNPIGGIFSGWNNRPIIKIRVEWNAPWKSRARLYLDFMRWLPSDSYGDAWEYPPTHEECAALDTDGVNDT